MDGHNRMISDRAGISEPVRTREKTADKCSHKSRRFIVILSVLLVLGTAVIIGIGLYQAKRTVESVNLRRQQKEYSENLVLATGMMLSGAADAETCCNLIQQVWYNAIYQEEHDTTDQYTKPNGAFVTDFNEALENLFADPDFAAQITGIRENQQTVLSVMKKLQNPPEAYQTAYGSLSACYDTYLTFTNMAINPTGSFNSFSADFSDADKEFMRRYQVMSLYLP